MHQSTHYATLEHCRKEVQQAVKHDCDHINSDGVNPRDYVEQLGWATQKEEKKAPARGAEMGGWREEVAGPGHGGGGPTP